MFANALGLEWLCDACAAVTRRKREQASAAGLPAWPAFVAHHCLAYDSPAHEDKEWEETVVAVRGCELCMRNGGPDPSSPEYEGARSCGHPPRCAHCKTEVGNVSFTSGNQTEWNCWECYSVVILTPSLRIA